MKVGIFNYSTLGDTLLALPLINGLRNNSYDVIQIGNNNLSEFYDFLKVNNIINDYKLYVSKDFFSYINIHNLDLLLFPPDINAVNKMKFLHNNINFLSLFSNFFLKIKKIEFIEDKMIISKSKKVPLTVNLSLSYIYELENKFNIQFRSDYLFFNNDTINKGKEDIDNFFDDNFIDGDFIVIYAFTKDLSRSMSKELLDKLIRIGNQMNYNIFLVGNKNDYEKYDKFLCNIINFEKDKILNLAGRLTFSELAGLFNKSRFVFSIDGGLLHFSLACRAKTISFWSSTIPESRVYTKHPYHFPMCKYLDFQPFIGEEYTPNQLNLSFDFSDNEIRNIINKVLNE